MTDRLTTIAAFACGPDPASQAELAKIKLNANGIKCFLAGKDIDKPEQNLKTWFLY